MKATTGQVKRTAKRTVQKTAKRCLSPLIGLALLSNWIIPAMADGTAAGTTIDNTAFGSFENPADVTGTVIDVQSNTVTLTISEVAGIAVTNLTVSEAPSGVTDAGPAQGDSIIGSEDVLYFDFRITNIGNDQTQFFIPDTPVGLDNATFGTAGPIQIIGYSADGVNTTTLDIDVTTGANTGTFAGTAPGGIPNDGSVPVDGYIDVRVPVKAGAGLTAGADTVTVILGNTVSQNPIDQNVQLVAGGAFTVPPGSTTDVNTADNADGDGVAPGDPVGAPAFEREASSSQTTAVGDAQLDYGDAPDTTAGTGPGDYQTAPGRGPSHVVGPLRLGSVVDAEATDSEDDGPPLEDDGVVINDGGTNPILHNESLIAGQTYTLDVTTVGTGILNAWIDFDGDGEFETGEEIATDVASTGGTESLSVTVPFGATAGSTYARFRYSTVDTANGMTSTSAAPDGEVEDYNITLVSSDPALRLVKRITSIGGTAITGVNDDPADTDDDSANWPAGFLQGSFENSTAEPTEEVEYTIYFLSDGNAPINNIQICDFVPDNTTYVPGSLVMNFKNGDQTLTDAADTDAGESFAVGATPGAPCPVSGNTDGGIFVRILDTANPTDTTVNNATGPGTPTDSFGYVRFTVEID
ncbi:MAG: GEVED domain-containing protein [Cyanobacteria bacterium J06626_6]